MPPREAMAPYPTALGFMAALVGKLITYPTWHTNIKVGLLTLSSNQGRFTLGLLATALLAI